MDFSNKWGYIDSILLAKRFSDALLATLLDYEGQKMKIKSLFSTITLLIITTLFISCTTQPSTPANSGKDDLKGASHTIITIEDPTLEGLIRDIILKPTGDITTADTIYVTSLTHIGHPTKITSLKGIEHFTKITSLNLTDNQISDLTPLANLTSLTKLYIGQNPLTDISPLANLTNITKLSLHNTQLSNISPLHNLTSLNDLHLHNNKIFDITPLENLKKITTLELGNNEISDLAPLKNLTALKYLFLYDNLISNVTPLINNKGFGKDDYLTIVKGNTISQEDIDKLKTKRLIVQ